MPDIIQNSTSETRLLGDDAFLRKVAQLYYEDNYSQETIADMVYCSRQTIGKALQKARERKIIRTAVVPDERTGYLRNLARRVRIELTLEDLVLVPGQSTHTIAATTTYDEVVVEIARSAAEYLDQMLTDDDIVAVSGGKTFIRNMVRYLNPTKTLSHMQTVATIGFADAHTNFGDANLIAYDLAMAYGASHMWFPCPAILPDAKEVAIVRQLPIVRQAYELMQRASIVITSLWLPDLNDPTIKRYAHSDEQMAMLEDSAPIVDINHWLFNAFGDCINETLKPFPYALSGIEISRFKERIQQNSSKVMLVIGGNPSYVPAIRAILKAGVVSILVTDHLTAQALLEIS